MCMYVYIILNCFRRVQNLVGHFKQSNPPLFELCACPWVWTRSCNYWLWYYPRGWNDLVSWDLSNYTYLLHNSLKTSINLFFAFPKRCTTWHCSHIAFPSILLTYFYIFSTGFLFFLKYSLVWYIHDCSLSLTQLIIASAKFLLSSKKVQQNVQMLLSCRYTLPFLTKYWATPLKYYFFPDLGILWNFLQSFFWQAVGIWQNSFNEATLVQQKLSGANIWSVGLISISVEHQFQFFLEFKGWKNWKIQQHVDRHLNYTGDNPNVPE